MSKFSRVLTAVAPAALLVCLGAHAALAHGDEARLNARWNGRPVVLHSWMESWPLDGGLTEEALRLEVIDPRAATAPVAVGDFGEEGGIAKLTAIGFANADGDPAKELIVIVSWPQVHYDYGGAFYEVRIYDDLAAAGAGGVSEIAALSDHFNSGNTCDCTWREGQGPDGDVNVYPYKTIASVKAELRKMGY